MDSEVADMTTAGQTGDSAEHRRERAFLVIDDDQVQRMVLEKIGVKAGYAVTTAATVEDAIKHLECQQFDCIVLDLLLNGQNGMLLLAEIAKFNSDALLVVISGASAALREETLKLATHFHLDVVDFPKPVDLTRLRSLLTSQLTLTNPSCP
jgi:DNA-binding NtrC family response regulator